jgi:hypothetical protein
MLPSVVQVRVSRADYNALVAKAKKIGTVIARVRTCSQTKWNVFVQLDKDTSFDFAESFLGTVGTIVP